jgi:hypothetical protein
VLLIVFLFDMTQKQFAPLSITIINQQQEQQQQREEEMMIVSPKSTTSPPAHAAAAGVVAGVASPTSSSLPIAAAATAHLSPADYRLLLDDRSEVSSLRCGSVPPNIHYDPAKDPFYTSQQFVILLELESPSHKAKKIEIPVTKAKVEKEEDSSLSPPEWLQLPDMNQQNNKKEMKKISNKKNDIGDEKKEKQTRSTKRRIIINTGCGIRRRQSRSLSEERTATIENNYIIDRPHKLQEDDWYRSHSEESPAVVAVTRKEL